jgi:hypothetical protein
MIGNDEDTTRYVRPVEDEFGLFRGIVTTLVITGGAFALIAWVAWLVR